MSKLFAAFLVLVLTLAFVPRAEAQSFTEMAQMRLAMGPGGNRQMYGQSGYSRRGSYNTPNPTIYDRGYDTPDRGHHQATQNNVNVWGAINTGLQLYNAWETRKVNRKLDRVLGDEPRPRRERRSERRMERDDDYEPVRRAEHRAEPEVPVQPPLPPEFKVFNATACPIFLYLNGQRLIAVQAGQEMMVPTLVGLTATGEFNGKVAYGVLTPVGANGAVVTAPRS